MSAAKEDKKKDESGETKPAGSGRKLAPMLVAVLLILGLQAGLAVGIMRYLGVADRGAKSATATTQHGESDSTEAEGEAAGEGSETPTPKASTPKKLECVEKPLSKTVTVAGTEAKRYLKASFCLEYDPVKYKELPKSIEPQMMRIEATVNRILSSATFDKIANPTAQDSLSKLMTVEINKLLKEEKLQLHAVLITEWLIQ